MNKLALLVTAIAATAFSPAIGQGTGEPGFPPQEPPPQPEQSPDPVKESRVRFRTGARPDDNSDRLSNSAIFRAIDRLSGEPVSAGVRLRKEPAHTASNSNFSIFSEYNYVTLNDTRLFGADSQTHSGMIGGDFLINGDFVVGMAYSFSRSDSGPDIFGVSSERDANFVTVYAAKTLWQFLVAGVAAGYGHTDEHFTLAAPLPSANGYTDTLSISPFLSVSYKVGPLTTSLTTTYSYQNEDSSLVGSDDTSKINVALRASYALTEKLKVLGSVRFVQVVEHPASIPGFPEDRNWFNFGARVTYSVSNPFEVYLGYGYDAFNSQLDTHTITGGVSYQF